MNTACDNGARAEATVSAAAGRSLSDNSFATAIRGCLSGCLWYSEHLYSEPHTKTVIASTAVAITDSARASCFVWTRFIAIFVEGSTGGRDAATQSQLTESIIRAGQP